MLGLRERARLDDADDVADRRRCSARRARGTCVERRTTFLYFGCAFVTSTLTTIVLSPLSETTTPRRSWRRPSSDSGFARRTIGLRSAGFSRSGLECLWRSERGRRFFAGFGGAARRCGRLGGGRFGRRRLGRGASAAGSSAAGSSAGSASAAGSSAAASSAAAPRLGAAPRRGSSAAGSSAAGSSAAGSSAAAPRPRAPRQLPRARRCLGGRLGGGSSAARALGLGHRLLGGSAPRRRPRSPRPGSSAGGLVHRRHRSQGRRLGLVGLGVVVRLPRASSRLPS